ncbi:MAG: ABC transporter substrate-binding protein [Oscillospiraceae bacterium]|nr:ABC transporter substrate-binding protein [Oscillospiraceae bacterium]
MKNAKKLGALLLVVIMCLSMFAACKSGATTEASDTPLVVGYSPFNSKFSPFFGETAYDMDVSAMTQINLLSSDRQGAIINKGIEGETVKYNGTDYTYYGPADLTITENTDGTVFYDFKMREDLTFSDGEPMTIDDVIFTMYVLCDPTYDGSSTLFSQPIRGLAEYRSGMDTRQNLILAAGPDGYTATDYYTEEQYNAFWTAFNAAGIKFVEEIKAYLVAAGYNADTDTVAAWAANWGYELPAEATEADLFAAMIAKYGYDLSDAGINAETAGTSISTFLAEELGDAAADYSVGVKTGDSAANIAGIQKTGDYSMRVVLTQVDATAIYQLALAITPMHYYGDSTLYDYNNNKFGFNKGDLTTVRAKTTQPMGAGPYKFIKFENGVVSFEANESYYKGTPKTKYINFVQCTTDDDKLNGVVTGTIDITDPSFSTDTVKAIEEANGGELDGKVITTNTVDNLGYGYLGMNVDRVNVGGDPGSEASKDLRKAFGTIFAVYRDVSVRSYYGERASVINYPISNTSWAAPQSTDEGYKVAFSTDVDGKDIYTSDMNEDARYAAALQAALGYFQAAGYTVENGVITAAPAGAALEYELLIPADGSGDHPSFMMITEAAAALKTIGINLIVTDLTNSSDLWTGLEAKQVDMWCAAWGAVVDPDMYQIYFSGDANNAAGGSNYMYAINDPELNQLILDARMSLDQTYRKAMYKQCLDIIVDWACEIPIYQRQNAIIFSTERVNIDTITPDITTFYGWMSEIENTQLA